MCVIIQHVLCPGLEAMLPSVFQRHGLKVLPRDPYSYAPLLEDARAGKAPRSLLLGNNMADTQSQIAQFSVKDAQVLWGKLPQVWKGEKQAQPKTFCCWRGGIVKHSLPPSQVIFAPEGKSPKASLWQ